MTKQKFIVRPAQEEDYVAVEQITRQLHALDYAGVPGFLKKDPPRILWRGAFLNVLENEVEEAYFVAEVSGAVVGVVYVALQKQEDSEVMAKLTDAEIGLLYVVPDYRRQGIATSLVKAVESWARKQKADRLTVVVYPYAEEATALYAQLGLQTRSIKLEKDL